MKFLEKSFIQNLSKLSIFNIKRDAKKLVSTNNLIPNTIWNCCCKYEVSSKENIFYSFHVGQFEPSRQDFFYDTKLPELLGFKKASQESYVS